MRTFVLLSLGFLIASGASAQIITTIAGGGPRNLPALQVGLAQPSGVAVDASGNVYVSLAQIHQVWKINSASQVTVFAGNGSYPYDGDGGQASASTLNQPRGLAFDSAGNLYVADSAHNRVRKVSPAGVITTVAGNGTAGFFGDGSLGTLAQLSNPVAVAVDSLNNLYIADKGNQRIRMLTPAGAISTLAGNGFADFTGDGGDATLASLKNPVGVAVDSAGAVYIADQGNVRVRKISSGTITTVAGNGTIGLSGDGGPAISAQLNSITGVTVDRVNNLYIVESSDIRGISSSSGNIGTVAGGPLAGYSGDGGLPTGAKFQNIAAFALDNSGNNGYIVDAGNNRIRKITSTLTGTFAGNGTASYNGEGYPPASANFLTPNYIAVADSPNGTVLLFADSASSSIKQSFIGVLGTPVGNGYPGLTADSGSVTGPAFNPTGFTFDGSGIMIFIEQNRIRRVAAGRYSTIANTANTPGFSGDGGPAAAAQFQFPAALARAANGDLYVADLQNHRVRLISAATGIVTTVAGTGTALSSGDGGLGINATLNLPSSLSLDGGGNLFIGELGGNRIRKLSLATNIITTAAGDGTTNFADGVLAISTGLSSPTSVFADQSSNLFIADQGHSRVRKVTAGTNLISTVAGNGAYDFSGDGGPAVSAAVNPLGVTVDRSKNLYIADSSGRIRTTPVTACFFTFGTPVVYAGSSSLLGMVTVTATDASCTYSTTSNLPALTITSGASGTGSGVIRFSIGENTGQNRTAIVNVGGASFSVVQAGALGQYNVGFFQAAAPLYALNANGTGVFGAGDKYFNFAGQTGAIAVTGDWNGDGRTKVGYYLNGFWALDYDGDGVFTSADKFYAFGGSGPSYVPVTGDWNGDGRTKVGYHRSGFWTLDTNGNGTFDAGDGFYAYGGNGPGEVPLVGDWNGDKRSKIGFFYNGIWALDYNGDGAFNIATDKYYSNFSYIAGDKPVTGDWNASGTAKIGIFRSGFWILDYNGNGTYDGSTVDRFYAFGGNNGDIPIAADWNGDGRTKVGVYNSGFWTLDFNGNGTYDGTGAGQDRFLAYGGGAGYQPLIGRW